MSYEFNVTGYYTVKEEREYPWPCVSEPDRMYTLFTDDVLCRGKDGVWYKQTGLGTFGHILTEDEVIYHPEEVKLVML